MTRGRPRERALGSLEREVVAADDSAVTDRNTERRHRFVDGRPACTSEVVPFVGVHLLAVESPLDRPKAIAQRCRALIRQRVGRLLHLFLRVARERFVPTFEEEDALLIVPRYSSRVVFPTQAPCSALDERKARATAGERRGRYRPAAAVVAGPMLRLAGAIRKSS